MSLLCAAALAGLLAQGIYWCPMHPAVRGEAGERCRLCGMALAPRPPATDAYWIDILRTGPPLRAGVPHRLRFVVRDPAGDVITRAFDRLHERTLHLFVVGHDLEYFDHLHPVETPGGLFEQVLRLPHPGAYRLIADFVPAGAAPQLVQTSIVTKDFRGTLVPTASLTSDLADKTVEGVRFKATVPEPIAGREQLITFDLEDAVTGTPIGDLEPYLGATGHLLLAGADLQSVAHGHPVVEISSGAGPRVVFQMVFPTAGDYRMWVQVQRRGHVLTGRFTVRARPRPPAPRG